MREPRAALDLLLNVADFRFIVPEVSLRLSLGEERDIYRHCPELKVTWGGRQ